MFDALYQRIARLAPFAARDVRDAAALETFRAVCAAGFNRRGLAGLMWQGARECVDLLGAIVRARLDERAPIGVPSFGPLWRDVRMAARSLWHGRRTTAVAAVTLALGIGVSAAVFSVLDATLWRPLPFRDGPRLVEMWNFSTAQKFSFSGLSRPLILEWRRQTDIVDRVEAFETESLIYETGRGAEMIGGAAVTPAIFDLLGVKPALGRTFAPGDGRDGSSRLVVVSDKFWRERLGATPDIDGRSVLLDGTSYRVIGVMPRSFRFPSGVEEVWAPYDLVQPPADVPAHGAMTPFARLAAGVTFDHGAQSASQRGGRLNEAAGGTPEITALLMHPGDSLDTSTKRSLWVLSAAVAFLFLIVCANVANLALSRSLSRARELATCAALGATPRDLIRVTVLEQLLLAAAGAAGGVAVAIGAMRVAVAALPDAMLDGSLNVIALDARAMLFMIAAGVISALLFGLPPAVIAARTSVASVLGRDNRTTTGSRSSRRLRGALAIGEVAVSVVLLIGAALMTRSFVKLASADQGYIPAGLISLRLGLPASGYQDIALRDRVTADIAERVAALPDVTSVTTGGLPSENIMVRIGSLQTDAHPDERGPRIFLPLHEVPSNYFNVLGIPIVAGRALGADDPSDAVIINQRLAAVLFPGGDAVGHRFRVSGSSWSTITGIAGNTRATVETAAPRLDVYCAIGQSGDAARPRMRASAIVDYRTVLIRSSKPAAIIRLLPGAVHDRDASIVIWKTALVEHLLGDAIARPRVVFVMMAVFAAFGLVLAMAGLYGVLSCLVAQRRQEIGVRMALGASAAQVRRLVLGSGLALTVLGLAVGLAAALPLVRAMRSLLYEVDPTDTSAIAGATLVLAVTAMLASWWPARDAGRINPVDLLRGD